MKNTRSYTFYFSLPIVMYLVGFTSIVISSCWSSGSHSIMDWRIWRITLLVVSFLYGMLVIKVAPTPPKKISKDDDTAHDIILGKDIEDNKDSKFPAGPYIIIDVDDEHEVELRLYTDGSCFDEDGNEYELIMKMGEPSKLVKKEN